MPRITPLVTIALLAYRRAIKHHGVSNQSVQCKRRFDLLRYACTQHGKNSHCVQALVSYYTDLDAALLMPDDVAELAELDMTHWKIAPKWAARLEAAYAADQIWCKVCSVYGAKELHEVEYCLKCDKGYHLVDGEFNMLCNDCDAEEEAA